MFEVVSGSHVPTSHLPFSPAVRVGNFVFVSGQASVDDAGNIVSDTFEGEMRRSLENLRRILLAAGLDLQHVVQSRNYIGSQSDLETFNWIYREYFQPPFPARTTIIGCLGDLLKYEIDVIACAGAS